MVIDRNSRSYYHSLAGLRGLAAVYIFVHNYSQRYHCTDIEAAARFTENGRVAISLSFVLAGFIMVHVHGHCEMKANSPCRQQFWIQRWLRLMPCYLFALLLNLNDIRCVWNEDKESSSSDTIPCTGWKWFDALTQLLGISTWLPLNPDDSHEMWNPVSWAVQTQLGLYFMFPFLLSLHCHIILKRGWRGWVELLLFYACLNLLALVTITGSIGSARKFQLPAVRCPEFAIGMLFGSLHKSVTVLVAASDSAGAAINNASSVLSNVQHLLPVLSLPDDVMPPHRPSSQLLPKDFIHGIPTSIVQLSRHLQQKCDLFVLAGVLVIIVAGFRSNEADWCAHGGLALLLTVMVFSLASSETNSNPTYSKRVVRFLSTSPLQKMGALSYAFYLVHFSWHSLFKWIGYHSQPVHSSSTSNRDSLTPHAPNFAWPYFLLSVGAAILMRQLIEQPLYDAGKKWMRERDIRCHCNHNSGVQLLSHAHQQAQASDPMREEVHEQSIPFLSDIEEDVLLHARDQQ